MDCGWHAVWVYNWTRWLGHGEVALWIHRHFHHALYAIFPDYSFHRHLHIEIRTQNDVCVLRNILLIIYFWWAFKTCWYQLVHTVILSSLMRIIVPSQIVVGGGGGGGPRDTTLLSTDKCLPFNRKYRATVTGSQYNTLWSNSHSEQN